MIKININSIEKQVSLLLIVISVILTVKIIKTYFFVKIPMFKIKKQINIGVPKKFFEKNVT